MADILTEIEEFAPVVEKLDEDMREAARKMGRAEVRYLVDAYYALQDYRKASGNQKRAASESAEPARVLDWVYKQSKTLEGRIKSALDAWTDAQEAGRWMKSNVGIGPVISAGFLADLDIEKAPTAGHFWSFCGLDPSKVWKKGEKRPWNARLKTLCWKLGDCLVKFHNRPDCFYGKLYEKRKAQEVERNERLDFKAQADAALEAGRIKAKETLAHYHEGKLPPGRIELRARRWVVKIFLSHLHEVMWRVKHEAP